MEVEALFEVLITSFSYKRTNQHIISMLLELRGRLINTFTPYMWSDDCDILYGVLVLSFGEYGISPRSGWFDDKTKSQLIDIINSKIKDFCDRNVREGEE